MSLEAQVVGTWGRLEGAPQLRGHFGRIPFDLFVLIGASGKVLLSELAVGSLLLSADGSRAVLSELAVGSVTLNEDGARAVLSELAVGSVKLSEDC